MTSGNNLLNKKIDEVLTEDRKQRVQVCFISILLRRALLVKKRMKDENLLNHMDGFKIGFTQLKLQLQTTSIQYFS